MKKKACEEVGIVSSGFDMAESVSQEEIIAKVNLLNDDPRVHGILIQV